MGTTTLIYSKPFGLGFPFIKLTESAVFNYLHELSFSIT